MLFDRRNPWIRSRTGAGLEMSAISYLDDEFDSLKPNREKSQWYTPSEELGKRARAGDSRLAGDTVIIEFGTFG
jgi:hypothetical protein